jgi:hypothetical protein
MKGLMVLGLGLLGVLAVKKLTDFSTTPYRDWGMPSISHGASPTRNTLPQPSNETRRQEENAMFMTEHPRKPYYMATSYVLDHEEFPEIAGYGGSGYGDHVYNRSAISSYGRFGLLTQHGNNERPVAWVGMPALD